MSRSYDIVVIGGGHAGIEASAAAARLGARTALITHDRATIGRLSCNPAIGGMAKGQLACEIDAIGGLMGEIADEAGIQFKTLGKGKGPAMWSPRAQADKDRYPETAREKLEEIDGLDIIEAGVEDIRIEAGAVRSVVTSEGVEISTRVAILCAGTFLCGRMHAGEEVTDGGRRGESSSEGITGSLLSVGFETGRLKTGTPPRIALDSIDLTVCGTDDGEPDPRPFSEVTDRVSNRISCYTTWTNEETHAILEESFDRSPMFVGTIQGTGPRYCPSIEDKVARFRDKDRHMIFLEPETTSGSSIYVNGFSTSMPRDVQENALRTIPGLENVRITEYGYAVEYDYLPPHQLEQSLMSRRVRGLFFAGQVNGTSGYEEAAAQGLMAGINAVRWCADQDPLVIDRASGYIGVLLDDLSRLSTTEPYRLFTSRSEYRLLLRRDNADLRLGPIGDEIGLTDDVRRRRRGEVSNALRKARQAVNSVSVAYKPTDAADRSHTTSGQDRAPLRDFLRRPDFSADSILDPRGEPDDVALVKRIFGSTPTDRTPGSRRTVLERVREQLLVDGRYGGYIERQQKEIERFRREEEKAIPRDIDYSAISSISTEGREKLARFRPTSLGAASRISGVSQSDLSVLMLYLR